MYLLQLYQGSSQRKWKPKGAGGQQGLVSLQHHFWDAHRAAPNGRTTARSALTAQQDFCLVSAARQPSYPWIFPPGRLIWKGFTTEPAQHRRQAAAPAPSRAVSCRRGFSKPCPTSRLKEPSPASRIFTPLPCQNRPVIRQQFRILPREEKIKLWLFLFGKQARGKKKKKKKHTAASSFDLKRKKITYTEHRMCKNRAPD